MLLSEMSRTMATNHETSRCRKTVFVLEIIHKTCIATAQILTVRSPRIFHMEPICGKIILRVVLNNMILWVVMKLSKQARATGAAASGMFCLKMIFTIQTMCFEQK